MSKHPLAWTAILPGGRSPSDFSLDDLRAAKAAHAFLTEEFPGPPAFAQYVRGFRFLLFFGIACVAEDKYPPLTRCWKDLERRFMHDPAFDDGVFVQSWALVDFPFGPTGETTLDYFEAFLKGSEVGPQLRPFIEDARRSRLGLHQDVKRTKNVGKFRELLSGKVIEAFPSVDDYGKGEILLVRAMPCGDEVFFFGNPKGFPKERKEQIEDMVLDKLFAFHGALQLDAQDPVAQYEKFMKLAGPYWMSCVCSDERAPILDPDHYVTYLDRRA